MSEPAGPKAVRATITDESNHEIGTGTLDWLRPRSGRSYETVIRPNATTQHAQFNLFLDENGRC